MINALEYKANQTDDDQDDDGKCDENNQVAYDIEQDVVGYLTGGAVFFPVREYGGDYIVEPTHFQGYL